MTKQQSRRRFLAGSGAVAAGLLAGCLGGERDERESFERTVDGGVAELTVETEIGSVEIRGTDREDVHVAGEKVGTSQADLDDLELREHRDGDRLFLERYYDGEDSWLSLDREPKLDLTIEVPRSIAIDRVESDNGDLDVEGIDGTVRALTDNGSVRVSDVSEPVTVDVDNGDVTLDGGVESVTSDNGEVDATIRSLADVAELSTDNGDVTAALATDLDVDVTVETDNGELTVEEGFEDVTRSEERVEFSVGEGSSSLDVTTDNGDVTIETIE